MRSGGWTLALLPVGLVAGCGESALPTAPGPPPSGPPEVTVHGVIDLTEPGVEGPQGARPPHFLRVDDGRRLGLILSAEVAVLSDVGSDGRGVTITGTLEAIQVPPVGPVWDGIVVSSFRFDPP